MEKLDFDGCYKALHKLDDYSIFIKKDKKADQYEYSLIEVKKNFNNGILLNGRSIFEYINQAEFLLEYTSYEIEESSFNRILDAFKTSELNSSEIEILISKGNLLGITKDTEEVYYK